MQGDITHHGGRRLAYLDEWRGLCIPAVLAGHFLPIHDPDLSYTRVAIFFVLSGRLMADILSVKMFPLCVFHIRRFSRSCSLDTPANPLRAYLTHPLLFPFGLRSYSFYIWQQIFYKLFQYMRAGGTLTTIDGAIFRPAFILAACFARMDSYYWLQRLSRRYINERWMAPMIGRISVVLAPARSSES